MEVDQEADRQEEGVTTSIGISRFAIGSSEEGRAQKAVEQQSEDIAGPHSP